jgi:hypothetical protein
MVDRQLSAVEQTMRREVQQVDDAEQREEAHQRLVEELLRRPARSEMRNDRPS